MEAKMETDKRRLEYNDQVRGAWQVVQCWAMTEFQQACAPPATASFYNASSVWGGLLMGSAGA